MERGSPVYVAPIQGAFRGNSHSQGYALGWYVRPRWGQGSEYDTTTFRTYLSAQRISILRALEWVTPRWGKPLDLPMAC